MRFDLDFIHQQCLEAGLPSRLLESECLEVDLGHEAILCFQNAEKEDDCFVGFSGTPWHAHDCFMFADGRGYYIEMSYLDLVPAIDDGTLVVSELLRDGSIVDRWLVHTGFNDEFKYMEPGEQIVVWRVATTKAVRSVNKDV